jgi:glyoxylase-like metal-dependent hydrolase (beta-lactamase superfamily II)
MPIVVSHIFEDEEIIFEHENIKLKAIFTPGHSDGHMMFEMSEIDTVIAIFC